MLRALGPARLIVMGLVTIGLIVFFSFLSARVNKPNMTVLYGGLELTDAGEITERLRALQVPYQLADNGRTILAPTDQVLELRMQFAGEGLGGAVGYELLDRQDTLGTSSFLQNINHRRALEGELARSIETINTVKAARVHLVLPERALFSREENKPSAAVTVRTQGGKLTAGQVNAIRQLVATSVPRLDPGRVSIVDHTGALLARIEDDSESAAVNRLHDRQVALETRMRQEIESLVERVVGPGRVRAEVSAELDFEQISEESEIYDPDSQVLVSSRSVERTERDTDRRGGQATLANNLPDAEPADAVPTQTSSTDEIEETLNYENSRTRTRRIVESGQIERLSVAVLVDGIYTPGEDGETTYQPRSEEQLAQISRLVQNAVGIDESRGDSIEVANLQFAETAEPIEEAESESPLIDLPMGELQQLAEILVLGVVATLVLFLVVRPILKRVLDSLPDPQASGQTPQISHEEQLRLAPPTPEMIAAELAAKAVEGDDDALEELNKIRSDPEAASKQLSIEAEIDVAQVEGKLKSSALKKVGEIIERHPDESAAIVRQWLYSR